MQDASSPFEWNFVQGDPLLHPLVKNLLGPIHKLLRELVQQQHRIDLLLKRPCGPRSDNVNPNQKLLFGSQLQKVETKLDRLRLADTCLKIEVNH